MRDNSYCLQYLDFFSAYDVFDVQLLLADLDHTFAKFASVRFSVIFVENHEIQATLERSSITGFKRNNQI